MLRLSGLDSDGNDRRPAGCLREHGRKSRDRSGEAEDMVDLYLDETDQGPPLRRRLRRRRHRRGTEAASPANAKPAAAAPAPKQPLRRCPRSIPTADRAHVSEFYQLHRRPKCCSSRRANSSWGATRMDAAPNERPLTQVTLSTLLHVAASRSRTRNTSSSIRLMRASARRAAGDRHPVVYVSSLDAIKFCQWLSVARAERNTGCRPKRNGNMPPAGPMAGDTRGEIRMAAAISPILRTATPFSPGVTGRSMMATRRARRWVLFRSGRVRSGWKTWPETFGNGASIIIEPYQRDAQGKSSRAGLGRQAHLSRRKLEVALQQPARDHSRLQHARIIPATISVSGSCANAT